MEMDIIFTESGQAVVDWWTSERADLICKVCGKCEGWKTEEKPIDCVNGNPYCG